MADLQSIPIKAAEFDIFAAPLLFSWSDSPCFCRQPPPVVGHFFFHRRLQTNSLFFFASNFPPRSNPNSNVSGNDKPLKHISYVALFCVGAVCVFSATAYLFFRCVGLEWDGVLCARYALVLFYSLFLFFFSVAEQPVLTFALISFPVRWTGPLRWDGRSYGVDVRGSACSPAASPGPPSEPRTAAALQPALRHPRSSSERYAHQHGLCCQRRFKAG